MLNRMMKADAGGALAAATIPPLRCQSYRESLELVVCGARATVMRPVPPGQHPMFFCDVHRAVDDVAIPAEIVVRRVHVTVDVFLSAASCSQNLALAEAVGTVERALSAAGAVPDVTRVTSSIVRGARPAPAQARAGK